MKTAATRIVIKWYTRFDVWAGLLGGNDTILSRDWAQYALDYYRNELQQDPTNIGWKIDAIFSEVRLIAIDMTHNFAAIASGQITMDDFLAKNDVIEHELAHWRLDFDQATLDNGHNRVTDFSNFPSGHPDSIVDPYQPGVLIDGPLWPLNIALIDWCGTDMMFRFRTAAIQRQEPGPELVSKAYDACQLIEMVTMWPESPAGVPLAVHACLGIAALFLPRDEKHGMWIRRKLATVESFGYVIQIRMCLLRLTRVL